MNKIVAKTVKKCTLLSIVMAAIVVLAVVLTAVLGANYSATLKDCNALTVTMNTNVYEEKIDDVEEICEKAFDDASLDFNLLKHGEMSGDDCEIIYEFDKDVDLSGVKKTLADAFAAKTAGDWDGSFISVSTGSEVVLTKLPTSYIVRAAIAVAAFAVLALVYVALRYRLHMGILAAVCSLVGSLLTAAVILLVRIPLTNSFLYVVALAAPVTAVLTVLTLNKIRTAMKLEENKDKSNEELIVENVATKEIVSVAIFGGVALVLMGAIATTAVRWFAVSALLSLAVVVAIGWIVAPALYLVLKNAADKKAANSTKYGYVGAKKKDEE